MNWLLEYRLLIELLYKDLEADESKSLSLLIGIIKF